MKIEQFYDLGLAHASYAILNNNEIALIDPARDASPYYKFALDHGSTIKAIIETHPHADFVSSHKEISEKTGAKVYVSKLLGADYPHEAFDDGDEITLGNIKLKAMNTPGHSPDSISILLVDESGKEHSVFTGDTLFIGDVGRPDLRENVGNLTAKREELARNMYQSTREKLMILPEDVLVYPAHGAGSLCGKNLSEDTVSTIGKELKENYALQPMNEDDFVDALLVGQPFIPKYFGYDVELNKNGADSLKESLEEVKWLKKGEDLDKSVIIIDTREPGQFKSAHLKNSINLAEGPRFETWLGSIIAPNEPYYLMGESEEALKGFLWKASKIGYEKNIEALVLVPDNLTEREDLLDISDFRNNPGKYQIIDVRNATEYKEIQPFASSINIPLPELRERIGELPGDKPLVVHCKTGYRSAAATSIIRDHSNGQGVYDLGEEIESYLE